MDYRNIMLTDELKRQRFEDRSVIKNFVLQDYQIILNYFNLNIPLRIYWRKLPGDTSGSAISGVPGYIVINLRDDINWFSQGGREVVREVLVHEMLHKTGLHHNYQYRKLGYYSGLSKDTYTKIIIPKIF